MLQSGERDYVRMRVGDVLMLCMDDSSVIPIQRLVESLVMIGPESLEVMREILSEISLRRAQVRDDQQQVYQGFQSSLDSLGVPLHVGSRVQSFFTIRPKHIITTLKHQGAKDSELESQCIQLLTDTRELMFELRSKMDLLDRIESYLIDWTWAVLYFSSHQQTGWTNMQ